MNAGSTRKTTCLHLLSDNATTLNRVLKESTSFLSAGLAGRVVLLAKWDPGLPEEQELAPNIYVKRIRLRTRALPNRLPWQVLKEIEWRRRVVEQARALRPMMIFCHSVMPLRTAVWTKRATGAPLVYDAHELETERIDFDHTRRFLFSYLERRLIRHCDAVICVSNAIADWYAAHYAIARPCVVRNIPDTRSQAEFSRSNILRERFDLKHHEMVFIYSGSLALGRRVEQMIRVFQRLGRDRHLIFMGYGPLESLVREVSGNYPNIHLLPAVPRNQILRHTAGADVGIVGVENRCLSYYLSLPNKMFEYLLASTPVLAPGYPEMRGLVDSYGCGWVVPDGDHSWQRTIEALDREAVTSARQKACAAARHLSWRDEEVVLFAACQKALGYNPG